MGCGINRRDAFSYTLAMTAIAAYPNRYDKAKALLAQYGYTDVSDAALASVRRNHTDEIVEMVKETAPFTIWAYEGEITQDQLTRALANVALQHVPSHLDNPAVNPMTTFRSLLRLQAQIGATTSRPGSSRIEHTETPTSLGRQR